MINFQGRFEVVAKCQLPTSDEIRLGLSCNKPLLHCIIDLQFGVVTFARQ